MALKVTKKPLFEFRGQFSGTKRTIFEFRGSKIREIRTADGGTPVVQGAHRTAQGVAAGVDTSKVTWVTFLPPGFAPSRPPPYRAHIRVHIYE